MTKQFRDFKSAREFTRKLNLKTQREWFEYCKSGNKPDNIPYSPNGTYKNHGWSGFGDWLGTGTVAPQDRAYQSFTEAREFTRKLNFKNREEWHEYCKSGKKPDDIPNTPNQVYKNDFKGFGDWLGTGRTRNYRSFEDAKEFVRKLNFKNRKEWRKYSKSNSKPQNIPASPEKTYKKDWKGMGDWLGTGTVAAIDKEYRSFEDAKEFVRKLKLSSTKEWYEYCKSGKKPDDIPSTANRTYKNDFKGMGDFLGTGTIPSRDIVYRSFEKAREFVRGLNLKGQKEWHEYCKSGKKPDDIPQKPERTYKNKGWIGVGDWLGTGTVAHRDKVFRPFAESREFVRSLGLKTGKEWNEYCKSGKKPDDIPAHPWDVYKEWKKK